MRAKICREVGCGVLIPVSETFCPKHRREKPDRKPFENAVRYNAELYNSVRWRNLRKRVLDAAPYCAICGVPGDEARLEVHHMKRPMGSEELFFDEGNLVPVCSHCHGTLTARETADTRRDR